MSSLDELNDIMDTFRKEADFGFVYIAEAHPAEEKHIVSDNEKNYKIITHNNLTDRSNAAKTLFGKIGRNCSVLLDTMENEAKGLYAASPDRIYVVRDGLIDFASEKGPGGFKPKELKSYLENFLSKK